MSLEHFAILLDIRLSTFFSNTSVDSTLWLRISYSSSHLYGRNGSRLLPIRDIIFCISLSGKSKVLEMAMIASLLFSD